MSEMIEILATCIERGKVDKNSPFPPDLKDQDGADEYAKKAVDDGLAPDDILKACMIGMQRIGEKFSKNQAFVPELLMSAKAMNAVMVHLRPFFQSGSVKHKGTFIVGTVTGDLHDIGKNLVAMVIEGNGWQVIDLGVDVSADKFVNAVKEHPNCVVGLSALLTTTMVNMENIIQAVKNENPDVPVIVGGAPLSQDFANKINADGYATDPHNAVQLISKYAA